MKKIFSTLAIASFIFFINIELKAQTLPNPSFETWVPSGSPPPFDWEEPKNWKSTNAATEFILAGISKSTDSQSGTYSAKIVTANIFGNDKPGILVNGDPALDFPNYTIDVITGGTPISTKPNKLNGFYKFTANSAGDSAFIAVILKKYNSVNNKIDTIGLGTLTLPAASAFTSFEVLINDLDSSVIADSVVVAFYSSKPDNTFASGELFVDNISLDFGSGIDNRQYLESTFKVYPNPASGFITIGLNNIANQDVELSVTNVLGQVIFKHSCQDVNSTVKSISLSDCSNGIYLVKMRLPESIITKKIIIQK